MKQRSLLFALPLLVFIAVAVFLLNSLGKNTQELPSALVGKPLPIFKLYGLLDAQQEITDKQLLGKPAMINIWATWCPSCLVEHPVLNQLAKEGVHIIGINYKDNRELAVQYLTARGNPFAISVFDDQGLLGFDLGVYGAPETFMIDAQGVIRERFVGVLTETVWREKLGPLYNQLLNEAGVKP